MKKVLISVILASVATVSFAQQWQHQLHHHHPAPRTVIVERNDWITPLIIGGIAGAVIANANNQAQVYVPPQPVYVQSQPQVYVEQTTSVRPPICSDWREIQTPDGRFYRERNCYNR